MTSSGLVVEGVDVPVFVINLDSRPDRWDAIEHRLASSNIRAERVSALTGADAQAQGYRIAVPEHEQPEWRLGAGALGCAASHLEIYRRVAKLTSSGAVIMEDDALLAEDFISRAQAALQHRSPRTALVSLGWLFYQATSGGRLRDAGHRIRGRGARDRLAVQPFQMGAHCYWVSQDFSAVAGELMTPIYAPIDAMLRAVTHYSSWQSEVHWPPLATQDGSDSSIR